MKKYFSIFIAFLLIFSVAACSGVTKQKGVHVNPDIRDYAVISNGGSAVQYGEYIYFINGYRGYTDESGNENVMGNVIKGGLYRTKLIDAQGTRGKTSREYSFNYGSADLNVFVPTFNTANQLQFEHTEYPIEIYQRDENGEFALDENDEKIVIHEETGYLPTAERIVGKTVGTAGYKNGGIFIYDNFIFFASPNNNRNRNNDVQYNKTDFYVTTLSGSETRKLYTTQNDTSSSEYAFYKYGGNYYLVVNDGGSIVSVCFSGSKVEKPKTIAEDVLSVLFPTKDIYYNFTKNGTTYASFEHSADDFIYYTRNATKNDAVTIGQVIEMMRPNGSQGLIISNDGGTTRLLNTDNGVLFYEVDSVTTAKSIKYSNFHNLLMDKNSAYKQAHNNAQVNYVDVSGSFAIDTSAYTSVRCVYPNPKSINDVYVLTFGSSSVNLHSANGAHTIFNGSASFVKVVQNRLYIIANEALQYVDLYEGSLGTVIVSDANSTATYMFDILDEYVVYVGDEDTYLTNCAKFKRLDDEGLESLFIGERTEAEEIPEE